MGCVLSQLRCETYLIRHVVRLPIAPGSIHEIRKFILFCVRRTLYALAYLRLIASACLFVVYWLLSIYLIAAFSWKSPQPSRG